MTADALRLKWSSPNLQMNGRPGQAQFGVDINGADDLGRPTGVQCKLTAYALTMDTVRAELDKSLSYGSPLSTVYIATTLPFDSQLQREVRIESLIRCQSGRSAVGLLFWGDIVDGLVLNPSVFRNYYPQIDLAGSQPATSFERMIWCVELGYFAPYLWKYVELIMGELGWMVGEDPDQLRVTAELVEVHASRILPAHSAFQVRELVADFLAVLFPEAGSPDFDAARLYAARISHRIRQMLTTQPLLEAQSLRLGMRLGGANMADDDITEDAFDKAVALIKMVLGPASHDVIESEAARVWTGYAMHRPNELFHTVIREATRRALG